MSETNSPRSVVVLGGAGGIGAACSEGLASAGWSVTILDIDLDRGKTTTRRIAASGGNAVFRECDASSTSSVEEVGSALRADGLQLHGLVNVVGSARLGPMLDFGIDVWEEQLSLNFLSVVRSVTAFLPLMAAGSSIVNIASGMAFRPAVDRAPYAASKAALISYTRSLAAEIAPRGVRVNAVAPGAITTERIMRDNPPDKLRDLESATPLGRFGTPEEVAAGVVFLLENATYVTGQVLHVNGGALMV